MPPAWDSSAIDPALQAQSSPTPDSASKPRILLDRTRNGPLNPNFDITVLKPRLDAIAAHHKLAGGAPEVTTAYLAAALRIRLEALVQQMRGAAQHRTDTQFDRPAVDVGKQAALLEKLEREEEMRLRKERKERADMTAAQTAALAAQAQGAGGGMDLDEEEGGKKKKKKADGPGVTARNMSEDVRKKMSNAVASQAAGISSKYSWMNATNAAAAAAKPSKASNSSTAASTPAPNPGGGWARAYTGSKAAAAASPAPTPVEEDARMAITLRDAQFVVEKERGHGGGKGSSRGWT
ncbi:Transcription initiation factor TFIID subunit 4 [Mycena kentingensis (nom. inval.)]|nr:Transcription initiation factor TFIID subunit 4 [Mycena kentingensis (nom. inval.)]